MTREEQLAASRQVDLAFKRTASEIFSRIVHSARRACARDWVWRRFQGCWEEKFRRWSASAPTFRAAHRAAGLHERWAIDAGEGRRRAGNRRLHAQRLKGGWIRFYRALGGGGHGDLPDGGIQTISAMAFGTSTIRKVQKIVGPSQAMRDGGEARVRRRGPRHGGRPSRIAVQPTRRRGYRRIWPRICSQLEHGTEPAAAAE